MDLFCGLEDELVSIIVSVVISGKESCGVSEQCNCCSQIYYALNYVYYIKTCGEIYGKHMWGNLL